MKFIASLRCIRCTIYKNVKKRKIGLTDSYTYKVILHIIELINKLTLILFCFAMCLFF